MQHKGCCWRTSSCWGLYSSCYNEESVDFYFVPYLSTQGKWDEFLLTVDKFMDKNTCSENKNPANEKEISSLSLTGINDNTVSTVKQITNNNKYSLFVFLRHFAWLPWRQHIKHIEEQKVWFRFVLDPSFYFQIIFSHLIGFIFFFKMQYPCSLIWLSEWSLKVAKRNWLPFPNMDWFRPSFLQSAAVQTLPLSGMWVLRVIVSSDKPSHLIAGVENCEYAFL